VGSFAATQRADNGQVSRGSSCLTDGRRLACFRRFLPSCRCRAMPTCITHPLGRGGVAVLRDEDAGARDAAGTGVEPNAGGDRAARVPKRDAKTLVGWNGCWSGAGCLQLGLVAERDDVFG
jgi:hypothetical protein